MTVSPSTARLALLILLSLVAWRVIAIDGGRALADVGALPTANALDPANVPARARYAEYLQRSRKPQAAAEAGTLALRASPINVMALRTLAMASSDLGQREAGARMLLTAGQFGWRDLPTQGWLLEQSLRNDELLTALARAEALVRLRRPEAAVFALFRESAKLPQGRDYLVERLAIRPDWREFFLRPDRPIPPTQLSPMADILAHLAHTPAPPTRAEARSTIAALVANDRFGDAARLHARLFPAPAADILTRDSGFSLSDDRYAPAKSATAFDWTIFETDGATARVDRTAAFADDPALLADTDGVTQTALVERYMLLAPGSYTLSFRVRGTDPDAARLLRWIVLCMPQQRALADADIAAIGADWSRHRVRFTVDRVCRAQKLMLAANPATGEPGSRQLWYDDVAIARN